MAPRDPYSVDVDTVFAAPALRALAIRLHVEGTRVRSLAEVPEEEIRRAFRRSAKT